MTYTKLVGSHSGLHHPVRRYRSTHKLVDSRTHREKCASRSKISGLSAPRKMRRSRRAISPSIDSLWVREFSIPCGFGSPQICVHLLAAIPAGACALGLVPFELEVVSADFRLGASLVDSAFPHSFVRSRPCVRDTSPPRHRCTFFHTWHSSTLDTTWHSSTRYLTGKAVGYTIRFDDSSEEV